MNSDANRQASYFLELAREMAAGADGEPSAEPRMIAGMAQSLRATLGRHSGGAALTRNEAVQIVELIQLLATSVADMVEPPHEGGK